MEFVVEITSITNPLSVTTAPKAKDLERPREDGGAPKRVKPLAELVPISVELTTMARPTIKTKTDRMMVTENRFT